MESENSVIENGYLLVEDGQITQIWENSIPGNVSLQNVPIVEQMPRFIRPNRLAQSPPLQHSAALGHGYSQILTSGVVTTTGMSGKTIQITQRRY